MRGRRPDTNIGPLRAEEDVALANATARTIASLRPKSLPRAVAKQFDIYCNYLADRNIDRLRARYVPVIVECCTEIVFINDCRGFFSRRAAALKNGTASDRRLMAMTYWTEGGRHGPTIRTHPLVGQMNESLRRWRTYIGMLGLSPADERNLAPGFGDISDETDKYFN